MQFNLKFLIMSLLIWSLNIFANTRFTAVEKEAFIEGLKKEISDYKKETKKPFEITKFQGELYGRIAELRNNKNISLLEEKRIISRFDNLINARIKGNINQEAEVFKIINEEISTLDKTELQCLKEGQLCNNFSCCDGLTCAADPIKNKGPGATAGKICSKDNECASGVCETNVVTKVKSCVELRRCYAPQLVGSKCDKNPVCASGECLPFDNKTSGYSVARNLGAKCTINNECNSNFCSDGICQETFVCKECAKPGVKPDRGLKCCEGLMINSKGQCVPDAPPMILPQVNFKIKNGIFISIILNVISFTHAQAVNTDRGVLVERGTLSDYLNLTYGADWYRKLAIGMGGNSSDPWNEQVAKWNKAWDEAKFGDIDKIREKYKSPNGDFSWSNVPQGVTPTPEETHQKQLTNAKLIQDKMAEYGIRPIANIDISKTHEDQSQASGVNADIGQSSVSNTSNSTKSVNQSISSTTNSDQLILSSIQNRQNKEQSDADSVFSSELNRENKEKIFGKKIDKENKTGNYSKYSKSDFNSCNIDFKADYYNYMMENKPKGASGTLFDAEVSFLAFDYMALGEDNYDDYWKDSKGFSIHKRLQNIAKEHQILRKDVEKKLIKYNNRLTCQCLDVNGAEFTGFKEDIEKIAQFKKSKKEGKAVALPNLSADTLRVICGNKITDTDFCRNYNVGKTDELKEYKDSQLKSYKSKAEYLSKNCPEEKIALAETIKVLDDGEGMSSIDLNRGDASGVAGAAMLVNWTNTLKEFNMELTVDNTNVYSKIAALNKWYTEQTSNDNWGSATIKSYDLFRFKINDNMKHKVYTIGAAVLAATLATGAVAIAGGFSAASILSSWAVVGIIAASAVAGAGGGWMVASLRGAWVSKTPFINDRKENQYDCGTKKDPRTCTEYTRVLKQPFSEICYSHVSSNACIKHFLVTKNEIGQDTYIVDPFIPYGIKKAQIIRDNVELVKRLEDGFNLGLRKLKEKDPGYSLRKTIEIDCGINMGSVGNDDINLDSDITNLRNDIIEKEKILAEGKITDNEKAILKSEIDSKKLKLNELETKKSSQDSGYASIDSCAKNQNSQLFSGSEDYRMAPFLDTVAAGYFAPRLNPNYEATYAITDKIEKLIKDKAKEFAIKEKFFEAQENERLQAFADYAYEFHFKWAKTSQDNIVAYPVPSFMTYLDIMSVGVVGTLATGSANAAITFKDLNSKYADNYKNVLSIYKNAAIGSKRPTNQIWADKEFKKIEAMQQQNRLIDSALGNSAGTIGAGSGSAISIGNNNGSVLGSLTGLGTNFVSSVASLRNARNEQVKKMDEFNKAVGNGSERGKGLLNAQAATVKKFASGNDLSNVGRNMFGVNGSSAFGSSTSKNDSTKDKDGKTSNNKNGLNLSDFSQFGTSSDGYGSGGVGGVGLLGGNSKRVSESDKRESGDSSRDEGNGKAGLSSEDSKRIENAIDARNRNGSGQYNVNGDDTLWEIITKTYIKNYDKVLKKRKSDKDTTEKN